MPSMRRWIVVGHHSQPCLGSIVEALRRTDRDTGLDIEAIRVHLGLLGSRCGRNMPPSRAISRRRASEVYLHEMPGGQFTNLKEQARVARARERWHEVAHAYADVNLMFGDIVKVTPSSKVVGDMALMMVAQNLTPAEVENPAVDVAFPDSVVDMMQGDLGQPPGGWPKALQKKMLKGEPASTARPGSVMPPADLRSCVRTRRSSRARARRSTTRTSTDT